MSVCVSCELAAVSFMLGSVFTHTLACVCVCETEMLSPSVDLSAATGCCTQGLGASSVG